MAPRHRPVTTLSTAQLERKRQNDRESQRSLRQRREDYICSLDVELVDRREQFEEVKQCNAKLVAQIMDLQNQVSELMRILQHVHYHTLYTAAPSSTLSQYPEQFPYGPTRAWAVNNLYGLQQAAIYHPSQQMHANVQ